MKRIKYIAVLLSLITLAVFICGCWNYEDVDAQFVVMGVIIDKEEDEFVLHAEISKAKGGTEAELITRIETARGKTIFDATRNAILKIGAKLYWGHAMVYIISEKVAKEGISEALSVLSRQTEIRSDLFIFICDDKSVDKIFLFDDPIHEDVSQHLHDLLESSEASGKVRRSPLFIILQELASPEVSLMLPTITMVPPDTEQKEENGSNNGDSGSGSEENKMKDILVADGSAIFSEDKMIEKLDTIETRSALILKKEIEKHYVAIEEAEETPSCAIEVINSDLKIQPSVTEKDMLHFKIELEIEGDLVELLSEVDFITDEKKGELEEAFNKTLKQELTELIKKTQAAGSDICGFAGITHRNLPGFWKKIQYDWDTVYQKATFEVSVTVNITSSSLSMNPIKVGR